MFTKRVIKLVGISLIIYAKGALAGSEVIEVVNSPAEINNPFYIKMGAGASFSTKTNISVDLRIWDASPNGYNSTLRTSELYEIGAGYNVSSLCSLEISGATRPFYKYRRFQTSNAVNTFGFLGDKTRFFELGSQALLLNLLIDTQGLSDHLVYSLTPHNILRPFFGGGLGVSYNKLRDFHSVTTNVINLNPTTFSIASIMNNHTQRAFAGQLFAGLMLTCHERFNANLGYRFFYGGRFFSNSYLSYTTPEIPPTTVPSWKGKLKANEVFISLSYALL